MNLSSIVPSSDLLKQIEGIETGLRQIKRLGTIGQLGLLLSGAMQLITQSEFLQQLAQDPTLADVIAWARAISLWLFPLFLGLFAWSKFWLKQSQQPFRYTCFVEPFQPAAASPAARQLAWLCYDLSELLSQRVAARLRFRNPERPGSNQQPNGQGGEPDAHIQIGGVYLIRAQDDNGANWMVEIMADVRIGPSGNPKTLAHPVRYPLKTIPPAHDVTATPLELEISEYQALLERVYFSIATEIYRQIQTDVAGKIALMPTSYLRGLAFFYEAEDYARSNTLYAHEQAAKLYGEAAQVFDRSLRTLPSSRLRRSFAQDLRRVAGAWNEAKLRAALIWPRLASRELICARAQLGYANMLLYRRLLAATSGQRINPVFEARRVAMAALDRLQRLPEDTLHGRATFFEAHVTLALAHESLGAYQNANAHLRLAQALDPERSEQDDKYLFVKGEVDAHPRSKLQTFRRAVELAPRFEVAKWALAYATERLWRSRLSLERTVAEMALQEYAEVLNLNPGSIGAWANRGYMHWLLGEEADLKEAEKAFQTGRDYKSIKHETFVAELDYGLARIAAEQGRFEAAYRFYIGAVSALIAQDMSHTSGSYTNYYFDPFSDAALARFERYKQGVERQLSDPEKTAGVPVRVLKAVHAFVLNDYGECCYHSFNRTADSRWLVKAKDAFQQAVELNNGYVLPHYNLWKLHGPWDTEATQRARQIQELAPEWPDGVLVTVETQAALAVNAKQQADKTRETLARLISDISNQTAKKEELEHTIRSRRRETEPRQVPAEAAGARKLGAVASERPSPSFLRLLPTGEPGPMAYAPDIEELNRTLDAVSQLRGQEADAQRQLRRCLHDAQEAKRDIERRIKQLVPHGWLWLEMQDSDASRFHWEVLARKDWREEGRWEKQLNELNVRALFTYGTTLMLNLQEGDDRWAEQLFKHVGEVFWPGDFRLWLERRKLSKERQDQPALAECNAAIRSIVERWRAEDPFANLNLRLLADEAFSDEERVRIFSAACARPDLPSDLYVWLGDRLVEIRERASQLKTELLRRQREHLAA